MARASADDVRFKRSRFVARFPRDYRYSPAHFWLCPEGEGEGGAQRWRIGLTSFATRMLGEIVEFDFEAKPGKAVSPGDVVGWVEGFKATADLFCVASGTFVGGNPTALDDPELVCKDPYGEGWLYHLDGEPDAEGEWTYKLAKEGRSLKTSEMIEFWADWVNRYDRFWRERLAALKTLVEDDR